MYKIIMTLLAVGMALPLSAQSEGGLLLGVEAEKKINRQLTVGMEANLRTRNNFKTMDRWSLGIGASYKLNSWLKASAGYLLLDDNQREKITMNSSVLYNNWRPSYWIVKHRLYASLTGSYKFSNNLKLSLRERWQYTYRPSKTVDRWDFDNSQWEDNARPGKGKNQLRSRLQVEYDKKRALLTPYASMELYHSWAIEKIRYTAGTDIRLSKQHSFSVYYRYQQKKNVSDDDYEPDMHYLGIGYKFKF